MYHNWPDPDLDPEYFADPPYASHPDPRSLDKAPAPYAYRKTFATPHTQYAARSGQPFKVVRVIEEPDGQHDAEVLPMFLIQFPDGEVIEAWPEEVLRGATWPGGPA